jgi:hypothetical protein
VGYELRFSVSAYLDALQPEAPPLWGCNVAALSHALRLSAAAIAAASHLLCCCFGRGAANPFSRQIVGSYGTRKMNMIIGAAEDVVLCSVDVVCL